MTYDSPIKLTVADNRDFVGPAGLLTLLAVLSALLSPQPVLLTIAAALILLTGWGIFTLSFSKVNEDKLILVILADGQVRIESGHEGILEGCLDGQQWCVQRIAVLRIAAGDSTRRLAVLSHGQINHDDFRRLKMWLQQDFCNGIREQQAPGV